MGTLPRSILRNTLVYKPKIPGKGVIKVAEGVIRAVQGTVRNCYQNKPKYNNVYSRSNLSKLKNLAFVINLDLYESIGTHWIEQYVNGNNITCFNSFLS